MKVCTHKNILIPSELEVSLSVSKSFSHQRLCRTFFSKCNFHYFCTLFCGTQNEFINIVPTFTPTNQFVLCNPLKLTWTVPSINTNTPSETQRQLPSSITTGNFFLFNYEMQHQQSFCQRQHHNSNMYSPPPLPHW